ncbi:MAG TPA: 50S ribosomal protein L7ae [Thermoanaerobacterales bacterium]|nr:50S ribosomal protein L7ae [Thermoanaerobacterales bacterium]
MNSIYFLLGITKKAGKIASGEVKTEAAIKNGKCHLVLIASDSSLNTQKKFINLCKHYNIGYQIFGEMERIGKGIGKGKTAVAAILDRNLAKMIEEKLAL